MFVLAKLFFILVRPGNLLLLLLLMGSLLLWRRVPRLLRWGRALVTTMTLTALAASILPIGDLLATPLEDRFPAPRSLPERIDGFIVLGAGVNPVLSAARRQVALTSNAARLTTTVVLARSHPEARILFCGGSGALILSALREATFAGRFFAEMGVDPARLVLEDQSRNTYENALFGKRLVEPKPGEHWVLITSAMHMPRSVGIFRRLGWDVIPYPVDYRTTGDYQGVDMGDIDLATTLVAINSAAKEWIGLAAYRLMGRTSSLFPGPLAEAQPQVPR